MSAAGRQVDAALREIERAVRAGNNSAATFDMLALGRLVAAGELNEGRLRSRLESAMENANEPRWRWSKMIDYLLEHMRDPRSAAQPPRLTCDPPRIRIAPGSMTQAADEAVAAIRGARHQLYQQGGVVVRVAPGRDTPALLVGEVTPEHLQELMDQSAVFEREDNRTGEIRQTKCPLELAKAYLSRRGFGWDLPTLGGIIHAPTMLDNGSILDMEGYDAATGLLLDYAGASFPDIRDVPTASDAASAANKLRALLAEFPFVEELDESVAMAAILTAASRRGLPAAPMFAFTAPAAGTGKSCLVDIVHLIGLGTPAAGLSFGRDEDENRKAIDSALKAGASSLVFDNVTCEVSGARLNQVLTQSTILLRVLGRSENVTADCNTLVLVNGNSLSIAADLTRRTLLCRLDANEERPELRKFTADPIETLRYARNEYLVAALTILRAYHVAGRPESVEPLGSFGAWSDLVRGALLWLQFPDPVDSMNHVRNDDPVRAQHLAVVDAWNRALGNERASSRRIIEAAQSNPDLREALLAVAGNRGAIDTGRLGRWLRSHRDRLVGGMKITNAGTTGGAAVWRLEGGNIVPLSRPDDMSLETLIG